MKFIDLKAQYARVEADVNQRIHRVLEHAQYIMGPEVGELEGLLADYVGVKHCIGVSSGSDALLMAMLAFDIGAGDEVITTPFTFIATGEMVALLGAKPVFVDIEPVSYNMDPTLIEAAITPRTRAILPVSLYGQCADMDAINAVADRHGLPVIEDGAQSFGATYKGRRSCGLSTVGCTSFFPAKPLGAYGDAGACFTNNDGLAKALREIRNHGQDRRYHHPRLGLNGRLDTLQAAVLLAKMQIFPDEVSVRGRIGARYTERLREAGARLTGEAEVGLLVPKVVAGNTSVYAQYTIQVDDRDHVLGALQEVGIPAAVHYPVPLNGQPVFNEADAPWYTPVSDRVAERVLSLPMHPYLAEEALGKIVDTVARAAI